MNRLICTRVFGAEDMEILDSRVEELISISSEIRDVLNSQEYASRYLSLNSFCPKRINTTRGVIENLKNRLDIYYKDNSYSSDVIKVRNDLINLFSNLREIHNAIKSHNDALLNTYNEAVNRMIVTYHS